MKCDQDLFLNLWYDLKKLLLQNELNPQVRSAFGNVSIFFDKIEKNIPSSNNEIPAHVNTATQWQALRVGPLPRQSHLKNSNSLRRVLHSMRIQALYVWSTTRQPKHTQCQNHKNSNTFKCKSYKSQRGRNSSWIGLLRPCSCQYSSYAFAKDLFALKKTEHNRVRARLAAIKGQH